MKGRQPRSLKQRRRLRGRIVSFMRIAPRPRESAESVREMNGSPRAESCWDHRWAICRDQDEFRRTVRRCRPPRPRGPRARPSRDCRQSRRPIRPALARCESHRRQPARQAPHLGNRPHVIDQSSIPKERAALAEQDVLASARGELADHVLHVPGSEELSLLDVHGPSRRRGGEQQIGLPAEKRRDLQQVADLGGRSRLLRFVNISRNRQSRRLLDSPQHVQSAAQSHGRETSRSWCGSPCRTRP